MTLRLFILCTTVSVGFTCQTVLEGHLVSVKILPLLVFNPILNFHPFTFVYDLMMNWENMYQETASYMPFYIYKTPCI